MLRQERQGRILYAAGELLLRYGYKRVTVEDVAARSGVGKGTVYLHWKGKEELFTELLLREIDDVMATVVEKMRTHSTEALLHRVARTAFLTVMNRPLARAFYTRDRDTVGDLIAADRLQRHQKTSSTLFVEYMELLRSNHLLSTEMDTPSQIYTLQATVAGFYFTEQLLPDVSTTVNNRAATLERVVQRVFEPPVEPLPELVAAVGVRAVELFELMRLSVDE